MGKHRNAYSVVYDYTSAVNHRDGVIKRFKEDMKRADERMEAVRKDMGQLLYSVGQPIRYENAIYALDEFDDIVVTRDPVGLSPFSIELPDCLKQEEHAAEAPTRQADPTPAQILAEIDPNRLDEADEPHQPDDEPEAVYTVGPVSGGAPTADETMAAMSSAWEPSDDELDHAAAREAIAIEARESGQSPLINLSSPSLAQAVEDLAARHLNREIAAHEAKTGRPFDRSLL